MQKRVRKQQETQMQFQKQMRTRKPMAPRLQVQVRKLQVRSSG